jgi:Outer membrane receptor for ferrienterochelin and colicins
LRQVVSDWGQATGGGYWDGVVVGNPDLKPEKSNNFEIGLGYTNDYGIDASATAFYTKYKDKIQSYYICDNKNIEEKTCSYKNFSKKFHFIQGLENVDKADLKGIELSFKTPLFTDFLLSTNYSWTKTEQKTGNNKGKPLNRTPKQKFNTQLDWNLTQQLDLWNIDDNFTLKGGYSTGYATPKLRQVVSDWGQATGGGYWDGVVVGNPDLKPEKSNNFEIGLGYTNDYGIDASATAFYTKYKDKIQSYYICDNKNIEEKTCSYKNFSKKFHFIQGLENVDKADLKGIELSFKTPLFTDFLLSTNYSWTKTEQKTGNNKGKPLNRTPKQKFNTQLDWYVTQKWDLWTKVAYYGVESTTDRSGKKIEYPSYTFWDVGASFHINKNAKIYGGVYNLFDKDVSNDDFGKTLEGRRYFIGTEINF